MYKKTSQFIEKRRNRGRKWKRKPSWARPRYEGLSPEGKPVIFDLDPKYPPNRPTIAALPKVRGYHFDEERGVHVIPFEGLAELRELVDLGSQAAL